MLEFGGVEGPGAESIWSADMVFKVASSSSSTTLATTVAAEDEYSKSSREGVRRQLALGGGLESNLKLSVKPSPRRSSLEHSRVRLFQDRRAFSWATK